MEADQPVLETHFRSLPLAANLGIFAAAAVIVWMAGTRLSRHADALGNRTRLSQAFLGMMLLGVATSLPEIATTLTGALIGNAALVTGNLFGGVALQIAVLAVVDLVAVRGALTYVTPSPVLLFQGVMLLLLLATALAGAAVRDPVSVAGVGMTPLLLAAGYLITVRATATGKYLPRWRPLDGDRGGVDEPGRAPAPSVERTRTPALLVRAAGAALAILLAGWALALTGDALAEQTGLGASFVGVALVAASTSLPELSTALAAVRQGNHEMAVSNILGTNCLEVALFVVADAAYRGGPILAAVDRSGLLAAAIGMIVTAILLLGLLERRNQTMGRMGFDSLAALVTYGLGLVGLYHLR
jgi:cation:H+ antiporter